MKDNKRKTDSCSFLKDKIDNSNLEIEKIKGIVSNRILKSEQAIISKRTKLFENYCS